MKQRRLQSWILAMIEDIKLTITACNRPVLAVFVDFQTTFDRMWYPALLMTLAKLNMPLELRRWICDWLQERSMFISHGEARSRTFRVGVGAPQGSVLAALLFKLHIRFLPSYLAQATTHLFTDDPTMIFPGTIERGLFNIPLWSQSNESDDKLW